MVALLGVGPDGGAPANAAPTDAAEADPTAGLYAAPEELAAFSALGGGHGFTRARELSEKLLERRPGSYVGHYVLGVALHYGEGDLARAVYHLDLAMKLFERRYGVSPVADGVPWRWHEMTLRQLAATLGQMERPAEELVILDTYDHAYNPKREAERVWPLMKLRRYEEARRAARLAIASGNGEQQNIARSDLCAAECEAGSREAAYRACTAALEPFFGRDDGGQIEYSNASEAALSVFKFDEAERLLSESIRRSQLDSWGNPYQHAALLYLGEGRIPEAIEALKGGQELRLRRPAWLDQLGQSRLDAVVSSLLLVVGQTERASQIAERAERRPDRQGVISGTEAQAEAAAATLHALALEEQAERLDEEAVSSTTWAAWKLRARSLGLRVEAWRTGRRATVLLADEDFLVRTLRPYYVGGADLPDWLVPEVVHLVGAGVAGRAIERARSLETFGAAPAYLDAIAAEAALEQGDLDGARTLAERCLARLPSAEALLRGRVAAIAAEAARRRGDVHAASQYFSLALVKDPDVLRRLHLALPVRFEDDGSAIARDAAQRLARSPRFSSVADAGHVVQLTASRACLLGPAHEQVACAEVEEPSGQPPLPAPERARRLVAALHSAAFAYRADLAQADLTTLDGSPTAARADQKVKSLLDTLGQGGRDAEPGADRARPEARP